MSMGERIRVYPPRGLRVRLPNLSVLDAEGAEVIVDRWVLRMLKSGDLLRADPRDVSGRFATVSRGKHVERFTRAAEDSED